MSEISRRNASDTMASLQRRHELNLDRPIFDRELDGLSFPARREIFVPQEYRALRARTGDRLENEENWANASRRDDLGPFLVSCLESPYTENKPILILGQPGSGKSLLTHVLTVQLASEFDVIRVELRNVDVRTQRSIPRLSSPWSARRRAPSFHGRTCGKSLPEMPWYILDGFDELLQATSGRTHAGYLRKVAEFQANESALGRVVRLRDRHQPPLTH